jgi:DNA-binding YbaB/EbfC family protein
MFGNIGKMMKLAGELKTKLPEMQAKLAASTYSAQAGGGVVEAVVNGKLTLVDLRIEPSALSDPDMTAETLADIVRAAVAAAQESAVKAAAEAMAELTGGVNIPGLSGMMGT